MKNFYTPLFLFCFLCGICFNSIASGSDSLKWLASSNFKSGFFSDKIGMRYSLASSNSFGNFDLKGIGDDIGVPIVFTGAFRFNAMYRTLSESYPNVKPTNLNIGGFGDGTSPIAGSPMLTLYSKINPSPDIDLGIGFAFNHIFSGSLYPDSTRSRGAFGQTFGINASFKTKIGTIRVGAGNLYTGLSNLFSGWSIIRFNPFYRLPWDESAKYDGAWSTFENIYENGSVTKVDPAYTNGGRTQGVILQLSDFPGNFGLNLSYGVDAQTGLFQLSNSTDILSNTKKTFGGRLYKKVNNHTFGITGIINNGYVNNVSNYRETQYMYSGEAHLVFNYFTLNTEIGATAFTSPFGKYNPITASNSLDTVQYRSGTDILIQISGDVKKQVLSIPIHFNFYNLGPDYINLNCGTFNTSTYNNAAAYMQVNGNWDVVMRRGFIADIGQSTNNRRALELSTQIEKSRFKIGIATQVGTEIQKTDPSLNQVMFYHLLDSWDRASFNFWTPTGGPYHRLLSNYIQLLESVPITDKVVDYKKTFNVFNIDTRYKTALFGKSLIFSNYNSYQSAAPKFSILPYFTDKAFVRSFYEELTAYYQLLKNTVIVGHAAYEDAFGNNRTVLAPNGKPINQDTWGFGAGIDWNYAPMSGLYFREMWLSHHDTGKLG